MRPIRVSCFASTICIFAVALFSACSNGGGSNNGGGGSTNNPVPTITSLSPSSTMAGSAAQTLTINGTNFLTSTTATFNSAGKTVTYVSATQITIPLTAADQATAGAFVVSVTNPAPGGGTASTSGAGDFTVNNPSPTVSSISPSSVPAGSGATTVTITGTGFVSTSRVTVDGTALASSAVTVAGATSISAVVPAADLSTAGSLAIVVSNPAPGGGSSGSVTLTVAAAGWTQLSIGGGYPPVMTGGSFGYSTVYDAASARMILFGGWLNSSVQSSTWALTGANGSGSPTWSVVSPGGSGGPAVNRASVVYDAANNIMIVVDGCESGCTPISTEVAVLANANGTGAASPAWSVLSPSGTAPAPRQGAAAAWDATDGNMIVFAGQNGGCCPGSAYTDTWMLTHANGIGGTPQWINLAPTGGPPAGVNSPTGGYNAADNRFVTYGGSDLSGNSTNAVWALLNANASGGAPTWVNVIPQGAAGAPPFTSGFASAAVYDPVGNRFFVVDYDPVSTQWQVWTLSNADGAAAAPPAWSHTTVTGGPAAKPVLCTGNIGTINPTNAWYDPNLNSLGVVFAPSACDYQVWVLNQP
jgi:hypothetical protein